MHGGACFRRVQLTEPRAGQGRDLDRAEELGASKSGQWRIHPGAPRAKVLGRRRCELRGQGEAPLGVQRRLPEERGNEGSNV
jgi:hypothetical protein